MTSAEFLLNTDDEIALILSKQAKSLRIKKNLSQKEFSKKIGIKYGTYIKFESSGQISLKGFITILRNLGRLKKLSDLLAEDEIETLGIEAFISQSKRKVKSRVGNYSNRKRD